MFKKAPLSIVGSNYLQQVAQPLISVSSAIWPKGSTHCLGSSALDDDGECLGGQSGRRRSISFDERYVRHESAKPASRRFFKKTWL
jgi:hypothetical protein